MFSKKNIILCVLYLVVFLNSFGYFLIMPVLSNMLVSPNHGLLSPEIIHRFGDYIYSIVLGGGSLACLVFAPIIGRCSDAIGRRNTLIVCSLLMITSFILPIAAFAVGSLWLFLLGNTINGISSNTQPVSQAAISDISQKAPKNLAYRYCIDVSVIVAAMTLGPSIGELLSDSTLFSLASSSMPFYIAGFLSAISLISILCLLPETNHSRYIFKPQKVPKGFLFFNLFFKVFADIRRLPRSILTMLFVCFLAQTAWGQYFQYLFIYLPRDLHFTHWDLTRFTFLSGGSMIFGLLVLFRIFYRYFSLKKIVVISMACCAFAMLGLSVCHQSFCQWLFMPILSIFIGMYFPALLTLFSTETHTQDRGWILSLSNAVIGLGWLITGFSAIWLSRFIANLPLITSAVLLFLAWIIMAKESKK
jgi:DHA1 family tetracycline resistance protein-like MFS transporter